jgi:hypothetical protein
VQTYELTGVVYDWKNVANSAGIPHTTVMITRLGDKTEALRTTTDITGRFVFHEVPAGVYTVAATHPVLGTARLLAATNVPHLIHDVELVLVPERAAMTVTLAYAPVEPLAQLVRQRTRQLNVTPVGSHELRLEGRGVDLQIAIPMIHSWTSHGKRDICLA